MNCIGRALSIIILLAGCSLHAVAADHHSPVQRHCFRIGWGDMMFETAAYYPSVTHAFDNPSAIPDTYRTKERFSNWYTGHIFAEYRYCFSELLSVGGQVDFEGLGWKSGWFDRDHIMVEAAPDVNFYNLVVMPTLRLTYLRKGHVSIYSGLGAGMLVSFAQKAELAPAFYINLAGVQIGGAHWSGSIDIGALNSLNGFARVYMLGSRIVSISLNYSW